MDVSVDNHCRAIISPGLGGDKEKDLCAHRWSCSVPRHERTFVSSWLGAVSKLAPLLAVSGMATPLCTAVITQGVGCEAISLWWMILSEPAGMPLVVPDDSVGEHSYQGVRTEHHGL